MNEEILKAAREANVPDLSCSPEGELMPWVEAFYRAAFNAGIEAAAKLGEENWYRSEDDYVKAIRELEMK